jgi:uncharacterized protein YjbI with pentapeptide repeats
MVIRWPARVKPGTTSDQIISQSDLFATCADILGKKLGDETAEDSVSILPALLGQAESPLREAIVHSAIFGAFAIRQGPWKLILAADSGGWSDPKPGSAEAAELPSVQLYNLSIDIGEKNNLEAEHPEIVARLRSLLEKYISEGRSTPGLPQPNTGDIEIYSMRTAKKPNKPAQKKNNQASPAVDGNKAMPGDELKSEQKSAIVFKGGNDIKDASLNNLGDNELNGVELPPIDLTGYKPTGLMLKGANCRKVTGLTVAMLQDLAEEGLKGTQLPLMDLTGYKPSGRQLVGADLRITTGLTVEMLQNLPDDGLKGAYLPEMDMTGYMPTGNMLKSAHLKKTFGLTQEMLSNLGPEGLFEFKSPAMDMSGMDFTDMNLSGADFTLVTGLTAQQLAKCKMLKNADLTDTGITESDLLKAGMEPEQIEGTKF